MIVIFDMLVNKFIEVRHHISNLAVIGSVDHNVVEGYGRCSESRLSTRAALLLVGIDARHALGTISTSSILGLAFSSKAHASDGEDNQ